MLLYFVTVFVTYLVLLYKNPMIRVYFCISEEYS